MAQRNSGRHTKQRIGKGLLQRSELPLFHPGTLQFTFMPDTFTTFAHLSMSARKYLSNSAVVMIIGTAPCCAQAFLTSGSAMTLLISALSFSTIAFGVFAGAMMPSQIVAS